MISKKCPRCRGCMEYKRGDTRLYLYCDFCDKLYYRVPGGKILEKEIDDGLRTELNLRKLA